MSNTDRKARKRARRELEQINERIAEIEAGLPGDHWGSSPDGTPAIEFRLAVAGEKLAAEYRALVERRELAKPYEREPKRPTRKYQTPKERQATRRRQREQEKQAERLVASVAKLTRTRKQVDEVMDR